jgi:mono/diheme cytochrome c family protein
LEGVFMGPSTAMRVLRGVAWGVLAWGVSTLVACPTNAAAPGEPQRIDFSREIQPLFAKRCVACHGPDTQEAGLRLDDQAGATAALESGARAIAPGKPGDSAVLARVTSTDPDVRMPPEGAPLTAEQVETLRRWIGEGAEWKEHWAFRPLARPEVPAIDGARTPIDAFIRAGLARRGLSVPPPAEKVALIRRVTYDVTGLPPTEEDVRAFVADTAADAWEKVVDRLLASPHYGERWARHWLDLVRYAETNSFERDSRKPNAWRYRDYVIRAFNDDKPYDRFVIEQLAGDELSEPTADALVATGYYRLGIWDDEPADRLQARYDWLDDIVATTAQTFLGLTINCARCHDHKIDPLPQRDYYGLLAFFENVTPMANDGPTIERPIFESDADRREYEARVADLDARRAAAQRAVTEIEQRFRTEWEKSHAEGAGGGDLDDLQFRFYRDSWTSLPAFDDLKPEDEGVVPSNLFDITVAPSLRPDSFGYVFTGFLVVPDDGDYTFALDSDDGSRLTIAGKAVAEYDGIHGEGNPRTVTVPLEAGRLPIRLDYFQWLHGKGLSLTWSGPGFGPRPLSASRKRGAPEYKLAEAMKAAGERILGADGKKDFEAKLAALEKLKKEKVRVEKALVVTESGAKPKPTYVFYRGNPHAEPRPENLVEPAFPAVLRGPTPSIAPPTSGDSTGRRTALAEWIASPDNPLTARVMANRIWQHHFGRGIVRSANNFGFAADPPTHPELLDWLASELVAGGWRLKRIHRLILLSDAYRAASTGRPDALAGDPLNDSFWRFDMRRLSAEEIRDSIHVASGAFNPKMFGPGVYPDIPAEVKAGQSVPGKGWESSPPAEQARRSIYVYVKRSLLTPILADFDLADTDTSCPVRFVTTQPTQALGMMNGEFLNRQARVFAERVRREALAANTQPGASADDDTTAIVRRALEIALVRPVTDDEVVRGVALIDRLEDQDGVGPSRAIELFCLTVLNLNEFVYLD